MSTLFHGPSERFLATVYFNIRCIQSAGPGAVITLFQKRIQHHAGNSSSRAMTASKSQNWNLTQSLLDSESGVADRALFAFANCALSEGPHTHMCDLRVGTNKLCSSPQWLFLHPCSWNWGYPHGWCSLLWGGQLT